MRLLWGVGLCYLVLTPTCMNACMHARTHATAHTHTHTHTGHSHLGTVSVGVSANCPSMTHLFAFFISTNAAATQSAQMLFRCRQLRHVWVSVGGCQDDLQLPVQPADVMAWVTQGHAARRLIPVYLRTDVGLARLDGRTPESDPAHLLFASAESFEGRAWLSFIIEFFRSRRAFASRLCSILARQGILCEAVDSFLSAEELKTENVASKAAKQAAARAEAALMAEHAEQAAQSRGLDPASAPRGRLSAEQQAGNAAVDLASQFGVNQAAASDPDWIWFYKPHAMSYVRAQAFFANQIVNSHVPALAIATDAQRAGLVQQLLHKVFGVRVVRACTAPALQGQRVLWGGQNFQPRKAALAFLHQNAQAFASTFGKDSSGTCRYTVDLCTKLQQDAVPATRDKVTAKRLNTFATGALAWFGFRTKAVYARAKRKKKPLGYTLQWSWTCGKKVDGKLVPPPRPVPREPDRADWQLQGSPEGSSGEEQEQEQEQEQGQGQDQEQEENHSGQVQSERDEPEPEDSDGKGQQDREAPLPRLAPGRRAAGGRCARRAADDVDFHDDFEKAPPRSGTCLSVCPVCLSVTAWLCARQMCWPHRLHVCLLVL